MKTNAERQKTWRDNHPDQKRENVKKYRAMRAKYSSENEYMDDVEEHNAYLVYRKCRKSSVRMMRKYPYHPPDYIHTGAVIALDDNAGQEWLLERKKYTKPQTSLPSDTYRLL